MNSELKFIFVGLIWGVTNPFIKKGSSGIGELKRTSYSNQILAEAAFLVFNWKYLIPFLISQIGSLLYYFTLQETNLTVSVPFTNSLAFLFTAVTGWILGEQKPDFNVCLGMVLIMVGIYFYVLHSHLILME